MVIALGLGPRDRGFESLHLDQQKTSLHVVFFCCVKIKGFEPRAYFTLGKLQRNFVAAIRIAITESIAIADAIDTLSIYCLKI